MKVCKICGTEYPYCKTNRPIHTSRWQEVACSPEHAALYFEKVIASRLEKAAVDDCDEDSTEECESAEYFDIGTIDDALED